ncbi:MAG TPA: hypothetical protein VGX37_08255 [Allosphingosinicella sp.]|jgi:hypothetical protein|nr:hypothetical protein [Allosphingosinicella sp.]
MIDEQPRGIEDSAADEQPKTWRPSRRPEYHSQGAGAAAARVIERPQELGVMASMVRFLRRPFVKLILGLGLFILAAIVYDATVNFGSWTERKKAPKATEHKGSRIPSAPTD